MVRWVNYHYKCVQKSYRNVFLPCYLDKFFSRFIFYVEINGL